MKDNFKDLEDIKIEHWEKDSYREIGNQYNKSGFIGNNVLMDSVHRVHAHYNYNGSSDNAFGGARRWPVVSAHVSFQMEEEAKAQKFAKDLMQFINNWSYDEK